MVGHKTFLDFLGSRDYCVTMKTKVAIEKVESPKFAFTVGNYRVFPVGIPAIAQTFRTKTEAKKFATCLRKTGGDIILASRLFCDMP